MGCATGSPIFQGVGCPEKKPVYNSGCYGRGCGRLVLLFPLAPQGLSLCDGSWKRRGSEWSAVDTREPADIPKLYLSYHTTVLSLEAAPKQLCPLCLIMSPNCLHMNYNMRRLEVLDNALPGFDLQKTSSSTSVGLFCTFLSLLCMLSAYGISLCFCCG